MPGHIDAVALARAASTFSLLAKVTPADVVWKPFPHLVVRDALPASLCTRLRDEMPTLDTLRGDRVLGSNERVSYPYRAASADRSVSITWRRFLNAHVGQGFLDRLKTVFGPSLRDLHPRFEARCGPIDRLRAGVRGVDSPDRAEVFLDAQICANSPVLQKASTVRGAHVDMQDKLFVGLYYLRHPADDSEGGDLQLYAPRAGSNPWSRERFTARDRFELIRTIRYENNVLVLLLNSIRSVHLVTARSPTPYPRLLVNLVGAVKEPLWCYQKWPHERLHQRMMWYYAASMPWTAEGDCRAA
jgi:hypothetical protein